MIIKKRIENQENIKEFDKYEFDLYFIDNIDAKETDDNTYIVVEQANAEDAYNAINYVNKYPGLITVTLRDLYDTFNESGVWKYKYLEENSKEEILKKLNDIKSNHIFLSIYCNKNQPLFGYSEMLDKIKYKYKNSNMLFGLPFLDDDNKNIRIHVFYK